MAASKRPAGALSPADVHRRGLLEGGEPHARCPSPWRVPRHSTLRAFCPLRRALLSARGGLFIPFRSNPPQGGGGRENRGYFIADLFMPAVLSRMSAASKISGGDWI